MAESTSFSTFLAVYPLTPGCQFLRDYFYAGGEGPISLEALQNQKYRDVVSIRLYYDWHTCVLLILSSRIHAS